MNRQTRNAVVPLLIIGMVLWTNSAAQSPPHPAPAPSSRISPSPGLQTPVAYQVLAVATVNNSTMLIKPGTQPVIAKLTVSVTDEEGTSVTDLLAKDFVIETIPAGVATVNYDGGDRSAGYYAFSLRPDPAISTTWSAGQYVITVRVKHIATVPHQGQTMAVLTVCDCVHS